MCACLACFQIGDPAVYLDYLRIAVGGELVMGVGLQYDVGREYHDETPDFVIGNVTHFSPLTFSAGLHNVCRAFTHVAEQDTKIPLSGAFAHPLLLPHLSP